jgi:hypothetical protein
VTVSTKTQQNSLLITTTTSSPYLTSLLPTFGTTNRYKVQLSTLIPSSTKRPIIQLTDYIIVSVGAFIGIPLIVLIIQKCSKQKSTTQNTMNLKPNDDNEALNVTGESHDETDKKYRALYQCENQEHLYEQVESDYQDIDQCVEQPNTPYLIPITGEHLDGEEKNDTYIKPEAYIEPQNLEYYLDPIEIHVGQGRENGSKDNRHSYIEVIELDEINSDYNHENIQRSSSSYDDVTWECSSASHEVETGNNNTYLDAVSS